MAAPGSARWLIGTQVRWQVQAFGGTQRALWLVLGALVLLGVTAAFFALRPLVGGLKLSGPLPELLVVPVGGVLLVLFTLMVSAAITAATEHLFTRGDLDLLLQSPVSPRVALLSRALNVAVAAALALALLLVPLLLLLLALGVWRGLGLLVWWLDAALLSACVGLWLTLGLVRWLGVRATRTVASVLGALIGGAFFLLSQWRNLVGRDARDTPAALDRLPELRPGAGPWPEASHPVWAPVYAAWLEPWPALALSALSVLAFALTVMALARQFASGVQEVSERAPRERRSAAQRGRPLRFARGWQATLLKEWRLLGRDPELLSRTLLQLVYLLPILAPALRGGNLRGAAGAGVVLLTASLASALANLTLNAEDAPDLLRAAPRHPAALRGEKWLAATLPCLALGLLALGILAGRGALGAFGGLASALLLPLLLLGVGGSALLVLWQPLPVRRADLFKAKVQRGALQVIFTLVFQFGLAATAFAASSGQSWGLATLLAPLLALALAYGSRRREADE